MKNGVDPKWGEDTSTDVSFYINVHAINSIMEPKARLALAKAVIEAATLLKAQGLVLGGVAVILTRTSSGSLHAIELLNLPNEVTPNE